MSKFKCSICGKEYNDLNLYIDCVKKCGFELEKKEKDEKKRLEEVNAMINAVKQAEDYYKQKLNEFKEKFPEEYSLNFKDEPKLNKNNLKSFEYEVKREGNNKPKVNAKVNGQEIDKKFIEDFLLDSKFKHLGQLLELL